MEKHRESKARDESKRNAVIVTPRHPDDMDDAIARTLTQPEVQSASVIRKLQGDNQDVNALVRELAAQAEAVNRGDMRRPEAMLVAQAHALDEIFACLARRSYANTEAGYLDAADRYMRLALKAQSQCRTTLETLAEIKNPRPVAFVKQANIANGPQQVNNGSFDSSTRTHARAENPEKPANELLGESVQHTAQTIDNRRPTGNAR